MQKFIILVRQIQCTPAVNSKIDHQSTFIVLSIDSSIHNQVTTSLWSNVYPQQIPDLVKNSSASMGEEALLLPRECFKSGLNFLKLKSNYNKE